MSGLCRIPASSTWILISFVYPLMSSQSRPASPTTSPSSTRAPLSPSLPTWAPRRRRQGTFHQFAARVRGHDARNHFLWALLFVIPFSSLYDHPSLRHDLSRIMQLVQETRTSPKARRVLADMLSAVFGRPSSESPSFSGAS